MIVEKRAEPRDGSGSSPRHAAPPAWRSLGPFFAALGLLALLVPLRQSWAAQVVLTLLLFTVPGVILLRSLQVPGEVVSSFPVYVPCASIVVMSGSALAVDLVGLLAGIASPLRTAPLLAGLEVTCLALLATSAKVRPDVAIPWRSLSRPAAITAPLILPLLAAAGALRLNSGHGRGVALTAVCGIVVMLITAAAFSSRLDQVLLKVVLYAAGLATLWSYSLRGDGVYGFDISLEYQKLHQTVITGIWHPAHANDAYGAMLSVTVLPAQLHALSGIPDLLVLKVIYPMVYALFPVAIFDLGRKVLSARWAFMAASFTMGQYAFTEIVGLARQEIALVLFVALVATTLDTRIRRSAQWPLAVLLGVTMAVSHYSTTYVAITLIGLIIPLQWATSRFREIPRITGAMAVSFIAVLAAAFIWYVPVTQSDSHLLQVAQTVEAQGLDLLPNRVPGGSLISAYLQGNTKTPIPAAEYQQEISSYYLRYKTFVSPLPDAGLPRYNLRDSYVPEPPVKWHLGSDALSLGLLIIEQLADVLAAAGALLMVLRRRASVMARQVGLLALVTTLLLTVLRFSGTLALAYGQERAQLQGLVLLAIALCWMAEGAADARPGKQLRITATATACLAIIFVNTSYLAGALLGGGTSVNLANSGAAFEFFYVTAPELASARWLGAAVPPGQGQLVYTDEYGQLPVAAETGMQQGLLVDLTPLTLNQQAWVYASRTNVLDRRAFAVYNNHIATYVFPAGFLISHYDLVYTNGSSEVFHR